MNKIILALSSRKTVAALLFAISVTGNIVGLWRTFRPQPLELTRSLDFSRCVYSDSSFGHSEIWTSFNSGRVAAVAVASLDGNLRAMHLVEYSGALPVEGCPPIKVTQQ